MGDLSDYKSPLEVIDLSGGLTDRLFWQDTKRAGTLDNFLIKTDKSLLSRAGSVIDDLAHPQIPAGIQRVGTLINYNDSTKLFVQSARDVYYRNPSVYATLIGPTGNHVFNSSTTISNHTSFSQWNGHLFLTVDSYSPVQKIYRDGSGNYQVRSAGLPALASSPVVTVGAAGANAYIYSFHYQYDYTIGTISGTESFEDAGPVTQVRVVNSADPGTMPNAISAIPVLANGVNNNWDTTVITVQIYRTQPNGQFSYRIGQVTNGTTTFTDNVSDASIVPGVNLELYTDDGSFDYDPPPECRYVHVVQNTGYYASPFIGGEELRTNIVTSIPGSPDKVPSGFTIIVEDYLKGFSSAKGNPIALCQRFIYRIDGFFNNIGQGNPMAQRISDTAGCVSNSSCVQAENGLFWFGNDGIYYTDGYQVMKVTDGNNDRYKALLATQSDPERIQGRLDEKERRIYWTVQQKSASLDNDSFLVLELRWGITTDMPFETCSGNSFRPSSLEYFNKDLFRGDTRGYVFHHSDLYNTDPKVDTGVSPSLWNVETIIWTYESVNLNFGTTHLRKYLTKMLLTAQNIDNTSIQIFLTNDDGKSIRALKLIRWRRNFIWGDPNFIWGNPDCVWGAGGIIEQMRRASAGGLRLSYVRVKITNGFSIIVNSDLLGTATFDGVAKTASLVNFPDSDWPLESVDYFITTEVDNYVNQFQISAVTTETITVLDPLDMFPAGTFKWELKGYKKGEPLNLLSYNLIWAFNDQNQMTFETGQDGGNT